jgi:hypothetical protein
MKKLIANQNQMHNEYSRNDLGTLVRGKYAARFAACMNIVVIDPVLDKAFPNSKAVNNATRNLLATDKCVK